MERAAAAVLLAPREPSVARMQTFQPPALPRVGRRHEPHPPSDLLIFFFPPLLSRLTSADFRVIFSPVMAAMLHLDSPCCFRGAASGSTEPTWNQVVGI